MSYTFRLQEHKIYLVIAIVAIIIGLGVIAGGIVYTTNTSEKTSSYVKTDATVIDFAEVRSLNHDRGYSTIYYSEIVEYTVNGQTYTAQNTAASSSPKSNGSKIKIKYNPDNPEECVFVETTVVAPIILFVIGSVFFIVGIVLLRYFIKDQKA